MNYQNFIQKEGASNIRQIVQEVNHISSPDEKLNTIARLIANNFTELYWSESSEYFYKDECSAGLPFNHRFLNNNCNGYGYDKRGALTKPEIYQITHFGLHTIRLELVVNWLFSSLMSQTNQVL